MPAESARALTALAGSGKVAFTFVVQSVADLDEVAGLEAEHHLAPVWVMPEGKTEEAVRSGLRALADPVLEGGWHLTGRLHVTVGEDDRGR